LRESCIVLKEGEAEEESWIELISLMRFTPEIPSFLFQHRPSSPLKNKPKYRQQLHQGQYQ
jgi:hypothetical protein